MEKSFFKKESEDVKDIFGRFRKKDFSGNTGQAIKNSVFQFSTSFVSKISSLIFTIVVARLLMPKLFGLYSLALSTILIFASLSDLGFSGTLVKFISSSKSAKKSKAYFSYILKSKFILFFFSIGLLVILAKPIAESYYSKPIFFALIAGSLYIFFQGIVALYDGIFHSQNNFKKSFYKEIILQSFRLILVPLAILLSLNYFQTELSSLSLLQTEFLILFIILAASFSFFAGFLFIYYSSKKEISFLKLKTEKLSKKEKRRINKFVIALSAMTISSVIFSYIDMAILGRFVDAEFIGYYRAAFGLIVSAAPLISFSGALFPLFSRLKGKQLERGLRKATRLTLLIGVPAFILTFILAPFVVEFVFGASYLPSIRILQLFSISLVIAPLIALNSSFLISQNKPRIVTICLILSSVFNIILNLVLINYLIVYGHLAAVYGVTIATIISHGFYLGMLVYFRRKK